MPRRVGDFRGLTQPNRLRLLGAIQRQPGRGVNDLAQECDLPANTVRDHLRVLQDEGLITARTRPAQGRGRPSLTYHPLSEAAGNDAARERVAGARRRGSAFRSVGGAAPRGCGAGEEAAQAQLDVLYEHLDDAGLDPDLDEAALRIDLAPCRYHEMIAEDQALVCSVHARLVRDVLGHVDGPLALARLEPFVTQHRCQLTLAFRADSETDSVADSH